MYKGIARGVAFIVSCFGLLMFIPGAAVADPPPPDSTYCPPVHCMQIDTVMVTDCATRRATVWFSALNWYASTPDNGVDEIHVRVFRGTSPPDPAYPASKGIIEAAFAPPGWTVQSVTPDSVVFTTTTAPIPEVDMCNPPGGCAPLACNNIQSGFGIGIKWHVSLVSPAFRANWHMLSNGVDNGDIMNYGALRWRWDGCGNISERYSNVAYPISVPMLSAVHFQLLALLLVAIGGVFAWRRFTAA